MTYCAPERSVDSRWTCFTHEELVAIAEAYNDIGIGEPISVSGDDRKIHSDIKERFEKACGSGSLKEPCWIDNKELLDALRAKDPEMYKLVTKFALKPRATKGATEWLSTTEIDAVLNQYMHFFPLFAYLGCVPSDHFDLHPEDLDTIQSKMERAVTGGLVFNLDTTGGQGYHWIAVFIDRRCPIHSTIEYFDPTGNVPTGGIKRFLKDDLFENYNLIVNKTVHQRGDTECGLYSIYYILQRLKGVTPREINSSPIADDSMIEFRSWAFRPHQEIWTWARVLN